MERQIRELRRRLERLEGGAEAPAPSFQPAAIPPPPARPSSAPLPAWRGPSVNMEELLGGRVLAWLGGIAIVLGFVFFLGMAIQRGWIDEQTITVLGLLASTAL